MAKHINVRVEHIKHSNCRQEFLNRVAENERRKKEAKEKGIRVNTKRQVGYRKIFVFIKIVHTDFKLTTLNCFPSYVFPVLYSSSFLAFAPLPRGQEEGMLHTL